MSLGTRFSPAIQSMMPAPLDVSSRLNQSKEQIRDGRCGDVGQNPFDEILSGFNESDDLSICGVNFRDTDTTALPTSAVLLPIQAPLTLAHNASWRFCSANSTG